MPVNQPQGDEAEQKRDLYGLPKDTRSEESDLSKISNP